jgi:hypothetical protein
MHIIKLASVTLSIVWFVWLGHGSSRQGGFPLFCACACALVFWICCGKHWSEAATRYHLLDASRQTTSPAADICHRYAPSSDLM